MKRFIETYDGKPFDVLIIGGGITGAALAYDAASRGLRVALLEKRDFSWATSAVTSKLIHGGVRYLANLEFNLVRESLRERTILENIAPNFVAPMPMLFTHSRGSLMNNKWVVKCGLVLYDLLSYDRNRVWDCSKTIPPHKTLGPQQVLRMQPLVREAGLTGASLFHDCTSVFPERLTLAFIKSAVRYGAQVANYARVEAFLFDEGRRIQGVRARDLLSDRTHEITSRITINCGGPWADLILGLARGEAEDKQLRRSEGIHLITRRRLVQEGSVVGSMTPKGRHFFLIPWRGHTLIGTTDKEYIGDPDDYRVTKESILELIDEVNASYGAGDLSYEDIQYVYGGLRPLVEDQTEETYTSSRRYEIYDNAADGLDGLITVEGGKYTTSRNLAEKVMDLVWNKLEDVPMGHTITDRTYLAGCEIRDLRAFLETLKHDNPDFEANTLEYLGRNYGTEYARILALARADQNLAQVVSHDGEILAEALYAMRHEMARSLSDIVLRRTGIATLGNPGEETLRTVAELAAGELGWDSARKKRELAATVDLLSVPAA